MSHHTYKVGERVAIINSTLNGRTIFEGYAKVLKLHNTDEHYRVRFEGETASHDRFVDPAAQADPKAFVFDIELARVN